MDIIIIINIIINININIKYSIIRLNLLNF